MTAKLLEMANKCITLWVELKSLPQLKLEDLNHNHKLLQDLLLHKNLLEEPRFQVNSQQLKLVEVLLVEQLLMH
jgi:hypothetical protein